MVLGQYVRLFLVSLFSFLTNFSNLHLAFQKIFSLNLANSIFKAATIPFMNKSNKDVELLLKIHGGCRTRINTAG